MGHADGLCCVYVDESASVDKAVRVVVDSKVNYPAACNSAEILLVHESVIGSVWPKVAESLIAKGVELRCDEATFTAIGTHSASPQFPTRLPRGLTMSY